MRIEFEGNALFAAESLKVLMRLKEGQPLDEVALDEDESLLFRYFDSVRVVQERVPGGVVLRFIVSENPLVVELIVNGVDAIPEEEIRAMMTTEVGYPLFPYALATDAENIIEAYRQQGYHFAQVPDPIITALPNGGRRVEFIVVEGPEVEVERIIFRGNVHLSSSDLREVMLTDTESPILPFLSTAIFRLDILNEDLVALRRRYEAAGYLDAEVVLDDLRFSDDKEKVVITIAIVEHLPYTVGTVDIVIDRLEPGEPGSPPPEDTAYFTDERIRGWLGLREGECYSGIVAAEGRKSILDEYFAGSYIDVEVPEPLRRGRERANVVDVTLTVHEGAKSRVRRLDFYGNEYTRDKVLRREARFTPGGYVDSRELERTLQRLRRLGYFERVTLTVNDAVGPDGETMVGWKDVSYEVVEGSTGRLNFGVGLSTDGGFLGSITYTKRNFDIARWPSSFGELLTRRAFTGAGQTFNVFLAPGTTTSQFSVSFGEPHLFGTDLAFGTQLYQRLGFWESYEVSRFGYGISLRHPIYRERDDSVIVTAGLNWRQEWVTVQDVGAFAVPGAYLFAGENALHSLRGEIGANTVDDLASPTWQTST
ncbi:MAG: BamA/OMP85 family outer membrane protein, partial [Planctomycetota bacterium]